MAVVAPMPSASVMPETAVKPQEPDGESGVAQQAGHERALVQGSCPGRTAPTSPRHRPA
jgi:hypothetical protein